MLKSSKKIKSSNLKKLTLSLCIICLFSVYSSAQLMVSKLVGKDSKDFGIGFGLFASLDIPLASGHESVRIELGEFAYYPTKGDGFFTAAEGKGYVSVKVGFKYVFSETQAGFYLLPSLGYGAVIIAKAGEEKARQYHGVAGAMEGGYSIAVGENEQTINLGLKYEYDYGNKNNIMQSIGFRVSYSFGFFGRRR